MFYYTKYKSIIGEIFIVSDEENIVGTYLENQKYFLENFDSSSLIRKDDLRILKKTVKWLDKYFSGEKVLSSDIKVKFIGTDFRKAVWEELKNIPYGETRTYKQIAEKVKMKFRKK